MQHMVFITMMLPSYSKDIIYQFVQAKFGVRSGMAGDGDPVCGENNGKVSVIMVLFLDDKNVDKKQSVSDLIQEALDKSFAKYYSVIIKTDHATKLIESNIPFKQKSKSKNNNVLKLIPKEPSKLGAPPDNIVE